MGGARGGFMSIRIRQDFYLVCDVCNNQYYSNRLNEYPTGETIEEVREEALKDGWKLQLRVQNGALWDIESGCFERLEGVYAKST